MSADSLIEALLRQEQLLVLPAFDEIAAFEIGSAIRAEAIARHAPVVIDIRTAARRFYFAALPGSSADNEDWARRKANVVLRCHASSLRIGLQLAAKNRPQWPDAGLNHKDYAVHGGSFPVQVVGVGVLAAIAVSGLPSRDDHLLITGVLAKRLGAADIPLPSVG